MEILEKTKASVRETNKEILAQGLSLVSSAFVLVAALAWNDAIHEFISTYLKAGGGLASRFIYAMIVTVLAVIVTMRLNKLAQKLKSDSQN